MNLNEAIKVRHSVRQYKKQILDDKTISSLQEDILSCNRDGGLHI